jgi:3-oxoacyl-[acyl-carrier protein] reductase
MSASLKGKSVIVTGGSKGIGKGIARVFASHGAKVLIVARQLQDAEATAQELTKEGGTASAFAGDVTKLADMQAMAKAASDRHGGLDVLCANAGIFPQAKIEELSPETWDEVMDTNLKGTFLAVKACVTYLKTAARAAS